MTTMKAMTCNGYGEPKDVFELKNIQKPVPKDKEILIKIHATMVTSGDCKLRGFKEIPTSLWLPTRLMFGITRPRNPIWGLFFAGEIEAVGKKVKLFKESDQVYGSSEFGFGAYAQFICLPEKACVVKKPANLSYEESVATLFGTDTAMHFLRKAIIQKGQKILINGASGSVGIATVQMAKHYGAIVTGVCSTTNLELVKSMGADHVIDYTKEDFTANGEKYDIVFDTVGKTSFSACRNIMKPTACYLLAVFGLKQVFRGVWQSIVRGQRVICTVAGASIDDLNTIRELAESGVVTPVIDRYYTLEEIPEAHIYVDGGHKKGNVVIRVNHDE